MTHVLVTGAAGGIGAAVAARFAAGAGPATPVRITLADLRRDELDARASELRAAHPARVDVHAATRARPGAAHYATSKAALEMLEMLTRACAVELGPHRIRVNAVAPGFVTVDSAANPVTEQYAAAVSVNPLGRRGPPDDVAAAVHWLCGDAADWITGAVLRVDGGSTAGTTALPLHWAGESAVQSGPEGDR